MKISAVLTCGCTNIASYSSYPLYLHPSASNTASHQVYFIIFVFNPRVLPLNPKILALNPRKTTSNPNIFSIYPRVYIYIDNLRYTKNHLGAFHTKVALLNRLSCFCCPLLLFTSKQVADICEHFIDNRHDDKCQQSRYGQTADNNDC